jgi:O-antigen/teichoic acid export membrane protein
MLGRTGFGELGVIQGTVGMFAAFAGFGLGLTATKHVAELRVSDPNRAGRIIGLSSLVAWGSGGLMATLLFLVAPWLATHTLAASHLSGLLRLSSLLLLVGAINGAQTGSLAGFEAFRRIAQINLGAGVISFPMIAGGVWLWGLEGAVLGLVASQIVNCLMNYCALRAEATRNAVRLTWTGAAREWNILWRFSLPALLSGVMIGPVNWLCSAILVNQPEGYGAMGLFNAANQWRQAILFLPAMLGSVALPMLSNLQGAFNTESYQKVLRTNLGLSFGSAFALALPVSLLSSWIMASYGVAFVAGGNVLIVLCLVSIIMATLNVVGQAIASEGRMWFGFILNAIWGAALVSSCFAFREQGALGLAFANLVAYSVHLGTVSLYAYYRMFPANPHRL